MIYGVRCVMTSAGKQGSMTTKTTTISTNSNRTPSMREGGPRAEQKGKKHDAACANSFHGSILSHCWTFRCPMQFFGSHTVAGVHDLLFQAYFLILSSAPGALSVMYSLKILEKIKIFCLSQQKFLYDTYKGLQFVELQGSAH